MRSTLRVANASDWGDDPTALARQVRGGGVDYVTLDFLAEITMVILVRDVGSAEPGAVAALTAELIATLRAADEGQEGIAAFLEKRPPRWVPSA